MTRKVKRAKLKAKKQRGGRSWSSPQVHVWMVKDGRATVFWQYQGDQQTEDEFWSTSV
jgi:hypothetical protein